MEKFTISNMDNLEISLKLVEKESKKAVSSIEQAMVYLSNDKSQNSFILEALEDGKYRIVNINNSIFKYIAYHQSQITSIYLFFEIIIILNMTYI